MVAPSQGSPNHLPASSQPWFCRRRLGEGLGWKVLKSVCAPQGSCVRVLCELQSSRVLKENIGILFIVIYFKHLHFYNAQKRIRTVIYHLQINTLKAIKMCFTNRSLDQTDQSTNALNWRLFSAVLAAIGRPRNRGSGGWAGPGLQGVSLPRCWVGRPEGG